jgi:hypothetical protein
MNQLALPLSALTQTEAEAEIIFGQGITHGDYWAGTVVRPVENAPKTSFVWMEIHKGDQVVERRLSGERRQFMQAVWAVATADQWTNAKEIQNEQANVYR